MRMFGDHAWAGALAGAALSIGGCNNLVAPTPVTKSNEVSFNGGLAVDGVVEYAERGYLPPVLHRVELVFHARGNYEVIVLDHTPGVAPLRREISVGDVEIPVRLTIEREELVRFDQGGMIFVSTVSEGAPRTGYVYY